MKQSLGYVFAAFLLGILVTLGVMNSQAKPEVQPPVEATVTQEPTQHPTQIVITEAPAEETVEPTEIAPTAIAPLQIGANQCYARVKPGNGVRIRNEQGLVFYTAYAGEQFIATAYIGSDYNRGLQVMWRDSNGQIQAGNADYANLFELEGSEDDPHCYYTLTTIEP